MNASPLDDVESFCRRFVAYPSEHACVAHVLWLAHAHAMDAWESTPRIAFLSPEPGSGKTRALEVSELLVPNPVEAVNVTAAYLFRKISDKAGLPTILYDEIDTVFGPRAKEANEEIRGVLNAGHRRGAVAGRCVVKGKTIELEELPAFSAVAMAGLGYLPDTLLSRTVAISMRRRAPTELVEPFRRRVLQEPGYALRERLAAWAASVLPQLTDARPQMPAGIEDRNADVWEALLALADEAAGEWPQRARVAAVALVAASMQNTQSLGVRLLADLKVVFEGAEQLSTKEILARLHALDESPWNDLKGKPLNDRGLAHYLRGYGVAPKTVRVGTSTPRGYTAEDLYDPWTRYLTPPKPRKNETSTASEDEEDLPLSPIGNATSATSATPIAADSDCSRCGGEGCGWCQ